MQAEKMELLLKDAVEETFQTTLGVFAEPLYFDSFNEIDEECVISSIGFAGSLEGSLALCLPDSSACRLVSRMVNQKIDVISAEIVDGIGEIANIILGGIKMKLQGSEFDFSLSVPSYIKGSRMVILSDIKKIVSINRNYKVDNIVFALSLMYKVKPKEEDAQLKKRQALEKLMKLKKS